MELAPSGNACLDLRPFAVRSRRRRLAISGRASQLLPFGRRTRRSSARRPACVLPTFAGRCYAVLSGAQEKDLARRLNGRGHATWSVAAATPRPWRVAPSFFAGPNHRYSLSRCRRRAGSTARGSIRPRTSKLGRTRVLVTNFTIGLVASVIAYSHAARTPAKRTVAFAWA